MASRIDRVTDIITLLASISAIVIAVAAVTRSPDDSAVGGDRAVENWTDIASGGQWIGASDARVVVVEFGDYECPACRGW